jgi:predicted PurR-regulated permease PerM
MKKYRNIGQIVFFVLVIAAFFAVVHQFVIPVIFGLLVSLVVRPVFDWLQTHFGTRRKLAAITATFLVFCCVLVPLILLGSYVVKDVLNVAKKVNDTSEQIESGTGTIHETPVLSELYQTVNKFYPMSKEQYEQQARSIMRNVGEWGKNLASRLVGSTARVATSVVFFMIALYFGFVDGPRLVKFIKENSPYAPRETDVIFRTTAGICKAVVLGAFLAGLIQGTIIGLAYWILGIPKPLFFGALTALFGLIPLVGSAPTGLGGTLYLLATGKTVKAIIMLAAFALAAISDNIVKPWVLKGKMSLHPFLGLLSVLGGIKAFGFAGIFLGPVITGLTITLLQLFHHSMKTFREQSAESPAD